MPLTLEAQIEKQLSQILKKSEYAFPCPAHQNKDVSEKQLVRLHCANDKKE